MLELYSYQLQILHELEIREIEESNKKKKNEWLIIQDTKAKVVLMYYNDEWVE